jgi:transcriptional regulator of acetoin/glycerol metabolism
MANEIALEKGFQEELGQILSENQHDIRFLLEEQVPEDVALDLGRRAARHALAPLLWKAVVGDVLDTSQVAELLDVSRQALSKRVRNHSLLAIPGRGITYFPKWQFDIDQGEVRPVVKDVLHQFASALGQFDPLVVVSWSRSPQHEELDGLTPQEWIEKGGGNEPLTLSAQRAASKLAA